MSWLDKILPSRITNVSQKKQRELSLSIKYCWDGVMGLGNWMGYALAAGYYIGLEFGAGEQICELFGYGYYVVDGLHWLVSFTSSEEGTAA